MREGRKKRPDRLDIMTPQEHTLIGSTPHQEVVAQGQWHTPEGLARGLFSRDEVVGRREEEVVLKDFMLGGMLKGPLGVPETSSVGIPLEPLDEEGKTVRDPRVLEGTWNDETRTFEATRDISEPYFGMVEQFGGELHLRPEGSQDPEGQHGGGPERE